MTPPLQAEALVVHLFVAADRPENEADLAYLHAVWQRCVDRWALTERVADLPADLGLRTGTGLLAGRKRPTADGSRTPHVQAALLRHEHDTYCLSVMREPVGATWTRLEREWESILNGLTAPTGLIGCAQVFLARLTGSGPPDPAQLSEAIRDRLPASLLAAGEWWRAGVTADPGFAVWEASERSDERALRRLVVVADADADDLLSSWTWVVGDRALPALGRYLLNAARLRHQLRLWGTTRSRTMAARNAADARVDRLLGLLDPATRGDPEVDALLSASVEIVSLQAGKVGLARTAAGLREMRRTVEIATANLSALGGETTLGPFADDRALGAWFSQQLADDETYLDAAKDRADQVAGLADQILQRRVQKDRERLQHRQERFNLGLTGTVGAILMLLAAIQSFEYAVPLPHLVQPAVVAALGAVALLASLLVLRVAAPGAWWSEVLVWVGAGLVGATAAWVVVSAVIGDAGAVLTWRWAAVGLLVGVACPAAAAIGRRAR
ncbi:CATRA conflict system CASPASE/TPR repeat-associated protein [Pseudonocardia oroxyli]|uniref:Uncharacterized protein n=1 Tax=Pseudonocardia oroxyli TaxID=366584 RepID=A0A1G7XEC5_PSEOR|nr:CATRA conflict system CASPASE/TPR repeat-associated protein [Pseudonocardia oroxyli]SDG82494.1 hypothetical protein SAMN05216377_115171 [Pseudonocardia oroxyli]